MFPACELFAQHSLPPLDSMYWIMLASRVLHLLCAAVLVGGLFYLWRVAARGLPAGDIDHAEALFAGRRAAWAMWVGVATLLLLATGFFNFFRYIAIYEKFALGYHIMFGIKFLLSLALFFLAALLAGRSAAAVKLRGRLSFWLGLCVALGVAIVVVAGVMRSYPHVPKIGAAPGEPVIVAPNGEP